LGALSTTSALPSSITQTFGLMTLIGPDLDISIFSTSSLNHCVSSCCTKHGGLTEMMGGLPR
jgi:hypothetical protein